MREGCAVHAYVLMTDHVHQLVTPMKEGAIGRVMQSLGRRYVRSINDRYRRTGTLWEGRYKACLVENGGYLMRCHRYIELNPLRATMVVDPRTTRGRIIEAMPTVNTTPWSRARRVSVAIQRPDGTSAGLPCAGHGDGRPGRGGRHPPASVVPACLWVEPVSRGDRSTAWTSGWSPQDRQAEKVGSDATQPGKATMTLVSSSRLNAKRRRHRA